MYFTENESSIKDLRGPTISQHSVSTPITKIIGQSQTYVV